MKRFLVLICAFMVIAASLPQLDNFSPIAPAYAKKEKGNKGKGKPDHAGGKNQSSRQSNSAGNNNSGDWIKDWSLERFVQAGFTVAALHGLLENNTSLLNTGGRPLPPGIARQLQRGKPLPPGIAKKQVGSGLVNYLPRIDGAEWLEVGTNLVLVEVGTQIVRQILTDVLN